MRGFKYMRTAGIVVLLARLVPIAHAVPTAVPTGTPSQGVVCLRDQNQDGFIKATSPNEVSLAPSAAECARMNGAVAERGSRQEVDQLNKTLDELKIENMEEFGIYLSALHSYQDSQVAATPSPVSTVSPVLTPAGGASSTLAINGPIPNVPAGGLLPGSTLTKIKTIIGPPLKGREFAKTDDPETTFNCQDFSEWAENAYRDLTYTGVACFLLCKRVVYIPGIQSPYKIIDAFGHAFNDYHQNGKIYFIEPQSVTQPRLIQFDLDLDGDGKVSPFEYGRVSAMDPILSTFFGKECSREAFVLCQNNSFEDRQHAYDYYQSVGLTNRVNPPKLPRAAK